MSASPELCLQDMPFLTRRQKKLIEIIQYRRRYGQPTVQRDLAEAMGIRRDSLNKLLMRTRRLLQEHGHELLMPLRQRDVRAQVVSLSDWGE